MRRPNKPHREGFEDEEDCEGYYDLDEVDRRRCHNIMSRLPTDPCDICFLKWLTEDKARRKAEWDAKTPEERTRLETFAKGLRELY